MTAPSVSASVVGSGTAVSSISLSSWTPSANDLVLVWVAIRQDSISVSSMSGNGITFALVSRRAGTQGQEATELWRGQVASPSTGQITVNFSGSAVAAVAVAARIGACKVGSNGADALEGAATADTGAVDTASPLVNVTTTGVDRLVLGGFSHRSRTFTVGSGETAVSINNTVGAAGDETRCSVEYQVVATAQTVAIDGTLNSANDWSAVAVAVLPAGNNYALTTTINSASTTPNASVVAVARALADTLNSASTTPAASVLGVARALATTLSSLSSTPDVSVLGVARGLSSTLNSSSSTPDVVELVVTFLIVLTTTITSSSSTPDDSDLTVARGLSSTVESSSSTSDVMVLGVARALSDTITSSSSTPDVAVLGLLLALATTINSASAAPDTATITNLLALLTIITSSSSTPEDSDLRVARALATTINSVSTTGDIEFGVLLGALLDHIFSLAAGRREFVVLGEVSISLAAGRRSFEAHLMAVAEVPKDPGEVVDFRLDYATLLGVDRIDSSAWAVDSGDVVVDTNSNTTTTTTARLSGGTLGTKSKVKNTVITNSGQTLIRRLVIVVMEM